MGYGMWKESKTWIVCSSVLYEEGEERRGKCVVGFSGGSQCCLVCVEGWSKEGMIAQSCALFFVY